MDPYSVLGLDAHASTREIVRAFRRLALLHHPDRNDGSPESSERFREVQAAYHALREAEHRPDPRHSRVLDPEPVSRVRARLEKLNESIRAAAIAPGRKTVATLIDDARWARLDVDTSLALKGHVADLRDAHWTELEFTTPVEAIDTFRRFAFAPIRKLGLVEMRNLRARLDGLLAVARGYHDALEAAARDARRH